MNNQYEYFEKSLTPGIAKKLIQELFAGQIVQKQEIMRVVEETHQKRDGLPSQAQHNNPVTLALYNMRREGEASNPDKSANWLIPSRTQDDDSVDPEHNNLDLEPEKIIGFGKQSVYLYYYPTHRRLAELEGEEVWACKIGRAKNDPLTRISSQTRTALPEDPKVGLIIKTDEFVLMEKTLQGILKLQGKHKQDAPGTEWFITSPSEVEQIYKNNFENS
ncbi:GIY-YIG nuclease family protein [Candidatus Poribacteria bacterium]|nr:GIY-YIG nuclease family protein [Candidatus Poribacteria bacterium]MYK24781.1 GIY-YIG nuclease family protein [Candidatus Poribacteria bacterium]